MDSFMISYLLKLHSEYFMQNTFFFFFQKQPRISLGVKIKIQVNTDKTDVLLVFRIARVGVCVREFSEFRV